MGFVGFMGFRVYGVYGVLGLGHLWWGFGSGLWGLGVPFQGLCGIYTSTPKVCKIIGLSP